MTSADDGQSAGLPTLFDIRISEGESAFANLALAKRLIEAALLLIDRKNRKSQMVAEMFSSFYLMILGVIFRHFFLSFFYLI